MICLKIGQYHGITMAISVGLPQKWEMGTVFSDQHCCHSLSIRVNHCATDRISSSFLMSIDPPLDSPNPNLLSISINIYIYTYIMYT